MDAAILFKDNYKFFVYFGIDVSSVQAKKL